MNPSILIAYPPTGEHVALDLLETLEPLGEIKLRPYRKLGREINGNQFRVAVCIVTDELSINEAHELQQRLGDTPTLVVDNTTDHKIPVNGFAGCMTPRSDDIKNAVKRHLESPDPAHRPGKGQAPAYRQPRQLASRFDVTLARLGKVPHSRQTILFAAARHLAWELRSDRVHAVIFESDACEQFLSPPLQEGAPEISNPAIAKRLLKYARPLCLEDLGSRSDQPLVDFLQLNNLDLITPLVSSGILIGWIALAVDTELITDSFLDDLYVVSHLLTLSLDGGGQAMSAVPSPWSLALSALRAGMLICNRRGEILDFAGEMSFFGANATIPKKIRDIRSPKIRELLGNALEGNYQTVEWKSGSVMMKGTSVSLEDGTFAVSVGASQDVTGNKIQSGMVPLGKVFEALPLPVIPDSSSGAAQAGLPQGSVSLQDSVAITRCAELAQARRAKSLKIRFQENGANSKAVLFFEGPTTENAADFQKDVDASVQFFVATP